MTATTMATTTLLVKTQALIELERSLTQSLEKIEPWLLNSTSSRTNNNNAVGIRVRPIPIDMDQVEKVLAVARNFSTRTSAPAGWNPSAPVIGFSTPNPLPHQLRGGALAALELQRARQAERDKKRKRQEEEEEEKKAKQEQEADTNNNNNKNDKNKDTDDNMDIDDDDNINNNKKQTAALNNKDNEHNNKQPAGGIRLASTRPRTAATIRHVQPALNTTMNLSDSSSSDDEEEDDDDSE
ncbi:MAG: hypothetical protein ACI90V_005467 [Bacillariaceae sp.]|jgi:hypothetical protein